MSGVTFRRNQELSRSNGLSLFLKAKDGSPKNAALISYDLYDFTTGVEILLPPQARTPQNPTVGEYFASFIVPIDANIGRYRIRWNFRQYVNSPAAQVLQEFAVVADTTQIISIPGATLNEWDTVKSLRTLLRDANPARNYHFLPPSGEESVNETNRVFGYIWEDCELLEFLKIALDIVNMYPPRTSYNSIDQLLNENRGWRALILTGAMVYALQALSINWVADEFGYAQAKSEVVLTPSGWKPIGSLKVGDTIIGTDETVGNVTGVYEQGVKDVFTVNLDGGYSARSCLDHLWAVKTDPTSAERDVKPLKNIIEHGGGHPLVFVPTLNGYHRMDSVVASGSEDCVCISVSMPDRLYVTNSGILTHNSIGGVSLDLEKSSKYQSMAESIDGRFKEMLSADTGAKATVKIIRGLQQSRYGVGIRSSFGPSVGRGALTPRRFIGA